MRCYYEVLDVNKDADSTEIKSSYRKLALKWHPDKNLDNADEAKEQFQLVQNAYEVLSDPQERAWYDSHREQLLKGVGSEFSDESLNLIPYFTASCYKGFGDDDKSFYAVYSEVFKKLAAEEVDYLEDPEDVKNIPTFGKFDAEYESVQEFYSYWLSFTTSKSYVWLDKYDIREADNRKALKILEKENNKIRQKARKERNEEIRELVNFVRKRDKRVIVFAKLKEEKALENKKKLEEVRRQKLRQRQQEIEEAKKQQSNIGIYNMDDFNEQLEQIEKHFAEEFGDSEDENYATESSDNDHKTNADLSKSDTNVQYNINIGIDDLNFQNLYCMACNKMFKNIKSFENHEKSKKHKENVLNLKLETEVELSENEFSKNENSENHNIEFESDEEITETTSKSKKRKNKKQKVIVHNSDSENDDSTINDLDLNIRSRKARRAKNVENVLKNKICENKTSVNEEKSALNTDILKSENNNENEDSSKINEKIEPLPIKNSDKPNAAKVKKKDRKVFEKKANTPISVDVSNIDTSHCCAICKNEFPSKNKLFDHLKKTGHQIYIAELCAGNNKSQKKKSRPK